MLIVESGRGAKFSELDGKLIDGVRKGENGRFFFQIWMGELQKKGV